MNRVVLITGSTRGIGFATAQAFLDAGDMVTIFCRHLEHVREAFNLLKVRYKKPMILPTIGDVRSQADARRVVAETLDKFGKIDILVNNAGVAVWKPIEQTSKEEFDDVIATNLGGAFLFTKEVAPVMKKQKKGVIINVSSGLGIKGEENYSAYSASKFGIMGLGESVAAEVQNAGIKIYAVLPGAVDTKLHRDIHPWEDPRQMMTPKDVAKHIVKTAEGKMETGRSFEIFY